MKEYILATFRNKNILLDLNHIKKIHTDYIREINENVFKSSITESPQQMTRLLFKQEDYIIRWLEHRASWTAVKKILSGKIMLYSQWKKASKKVFLDH